MTPTAPRPAARWLAPLAADLACVLVFAAAGKATHEASASNWVILAIVWPYALAAVLAHGVLVARGRPAGRLWPEGAMVLAVTYVLGMLLRAVSGRGIEVDFLVVAVIFLALMMLGWRGIAQVAGRRRTSRP